MQAAIYKIIAQIDLLSLVLGAIAGIVLGFFYNSFRQRPRLTWAGPGGGGCYIDEERQQVYVGLYVANRPLFVGIRLGETNLFGVQLHGPIEWGWQNERGPARECSAYLLDAKTKEQTPLYFVTPNEPFGYSNIVTLTSGDRRMLAVMARSEKNDASYFPFMPDWSDPSLFVVPSPGHRFRESREFTVVCRYGPSGSASIKKKLGIAKRVDGLVFQWGRKSKAGWATF